MNTINSNLKEIRNNKGITQQELADKLFVTRQCVSRWEQGKTLPDINSIEKIAEILECSINDLVDDNSMKSLTISSAIGNKKNKKILWITLCISVIAIIGVLISFLVPNDDFEQLSFTFSNYSAYVSEIDYDTNKLTVVKEDSNISLDINFSNSIDSLMDNRGNPLRFDEIKLADKLYINHLIDEDTYSIKVLDSAIDEELYGIFISGTGLSYNSIDDVKSDASVQYIEVNDSGANFKYTQSYNYDSVLEETFCEQIYDLYIKVNPLEVSNDIEIGLITSNGIRVVDTINIDSNYQEFTYKGDINFVTEDYGVNWGITSFHIDNFDITYNVFVEWEFSFSVLEIYEYDKNHNLIKETTINSIDDLRLFEADDSALSCLVKVVTNKTNGTTIWDESIIYELLLGERLNLTRSDDSGFVTDEWFIYD